MEKRSGFRKYLKVALIIAGVLLFAEIMSIAAVGYYIYYDQNSGYEEPHPFRSEEAREKFINAYNKRSARWPVPSETSMVQTSFGETFVRISGPEDSPPLILFHGGNANHQQWMPNIEAFSRHFRTYAADDILGSGLSVNTRTLVTAEDYTTWMNELFDGLGLTDDISLCGLSYGGWMTGRYALRYPERVRKIVLLAPAGTVLPLKNELLIRAVASALPFRYFMKSFVYWLLEDGVRQGYTNYIDIEEEIDFGRLVLKSFKFRQLVNPGVMTDFELRGLSVPALYLVGENEKIYSPTEALRRLHRVALQVQTELIPEAGHDLWFVQADMVNDIIVKFLTSSDAVYESEGIR